jgi:hypothetical protein
MRDAQVLIAAALPLMLFNTAFACMLHPTLAGTSGALQTSQQQTSSAAAPVALSSLLLLCLCNHPTDADAPITTTSPTLHHPSWGPTQPL